MAGFLRRILGGGRSGEVVNAPSIPYEDAKTLARDSNPAVRRALARRDDLKPEILYFLAEDSDAEVRRTIAQNDATPRQADLLLAKDDSDSVRIDLARKIGRLAPSLTPSEQDALQSLTVQALEILARDTLVQVRRLIAEEIRSLDTVPKSVVTRLAHDAELVVAAPILEYSPMLRDEDLLEIINAAPIRGALSAISRRTGVSEAVADAISASDDEDAVAALLANDSAQIREETLDAIIDKAPDHEAWHQPLVLRRHLSARAIRRISRFVASSLLEQLKAQHPIAEEMSREVVQRVDDRLADTSLEQRTAAASEAKIMHDKGLLDESALLQKLDAGDKEFTIQGLALLADLDPVIVRKIARAKSAKGLTALAWRAGLTMRGALALQQKLANIESAGLLYAKDGVGFPMDEEEMKWRLELFLE